jgi:AraC-like DNA-binding protein
MKKDLLKERLHYEVDNNHYLGDRFFIETAESTANKPGNYLREKGHDYFCISLTYGKSSSHKFENNAAMESSAAVLLYEKGEILVHPGTRRRFIDLYFSQRYLDGENLPWNDYLNNVFVNSFIRLTDAELSDLHSYFSLILYEYRKNDYKTPAVIANLLMIVFKMIIECGTKATFQQDSLAWRSAYFEFKTLIEQHFKTQHHVQAYADQLNMTAEMLGKVVKHTVNKTPKQVIDERLIGEAKRLLAWTRLSNKEIAYHLGFETNSYFNRYFKKHCQQTPVNFRHLLQKHQIANYYTQGNFSNC